ncbi:MAG: alpha/beta hydrolase, partial [Alphaproteobacteria bacterium]|nr:alpha/beta hydrolase [Alphaproteobacteria bacterium]
QRGYVDTRHGQMHYRESGQGSPLLLLHATPRSSRVYAKLQPLLSDAFRVIAPDTLGFGNSDPLPAAVTMDMLAESTADLIAALGLGKVAVFGLHTGNKVGTALAAARPDLVSHFICCGMTHSIVVERDKRDGAIKDIVDKYFAKESVAPDGSHLLRGWARAFKTVSEVWWAPRIVDATPLTPVAIQDARDEVIDRLQAQVSFDAVYRANFAFDLAEALGCVAAPTLILELVTPGEAHLGRQADACVRLMADAHAIVFEGSDRDLLEHDPAKLATAIVGFVRR